MNIIINNPQKAECFASLFQHIRVFTDNVNIIFEKDRFYMQTMDSSKISILEISIPSDWFDVYEHKEANSITLGMNTSILFKILNSRDKTQQINIVYNNSDDKLCFHFTSDNKAEFDKHFEISLMDIDMEMMSIPEIEYQAEFTLGSHNFANIIHQLEMFGDSLDINCSEDKILLCASSNEQGKMFVEIKIDDLSEFTIDEGESVELSFSLKLLHNICLYNKISKEIELKFSNNYPLKIIYKLIGHENASMVFYLAPKINE
jgi:proliferating cell nuclear antigen PCNA